MAHDKLTRLFFWACGIALLAIILLTLQRRGLTGEPSWNRAARLWRHRLFLVFATEAVEPRGGRPMRGLAGDRSSSRGRIYSPNPFRSHGAIA